MKDFFIDSALNVEHSNKKFLKGLVYCNSLTFKQYNLTYDLPNKYKKDYYFLKSLFNYFSEHYKTFDKVFLTITLPSQYHNPKTPFDIQKGYQKLNSIFIAYRKHLQKYKITLKYVKFFEMHKDFTPHLHAILYLDYSNAYYFKRYNKKFNFNFASNAFYRIKKKYGGGRSQFKKIYGDVGVQKYVSKYIAKSLNPDSLMDLYLLDGWKRAAKIRLFTYSKVPLPKYIFQKLIASDYVSYDSIKDTYSDLYEYYLKNTDIKYFYKKKVYQVKKSEKSNYVVNVYLNDRYMYCSDFYINRALIYKYLYLGYSDFRLDNFFSFYSKQDYLITFEFKGVLIEIYDISRLIDDLYYFYTEQESYRYVEDIEIFKGDELIFKKSYNFLIKDFVC